MTEPPAKPPTSTLGDPRFEFECARTWDSLDPTRDPDVRHCDTCRHLVHRVHSDAALQEHGRRGHCVALLPDPYVWPRAAMRTGRPREVLPGAGTAWLTVLTGPEAGRVIELRGADLTLGRGPADVELADASLAPRHLRFTRAHGQITCHELARVDAVARVLVDGDVVELGDQRAIFKTVADAADA